MEIVPAGIIFRSNKTRAEILKILPRKRIQILISRTHGHSIYIDFSLKFDSKKLKQNDHKNYDNNPFVVVL
jgi:hypothetical protein